MQIFSWRQFAWTFKTYFLGKNEHGHQFVGCYIGPESAKVNGIPFIYSKYGDILCPYSTKQV